jgi:hypothetical protein
MGWQVVYVPFLFAGNTIIEAAGVFVYSGTPALGNLIASIASTAGVDDFGNVVQAGMTEYLTISGTTYGAGLNTLSGTGLPGLSIQDIAHLPTSPAGFFGESSSNVSTPQAFAAITSGQANATDVASFISILSQVQSLVTGGQLVLQAGDVQFDINGNLADWTVGTTDGMAAVKNNLFGDGNTYKVGQFTQRSASNQPITSTTPVVITSQAWNVAVGPVYHLNIMAVVSPDQGAGGATFGWDGSAVTGNANGHGTWKQNAAADNVQIWDGNLAALAASHAFAAGIEQVFVAEIWCSFSTGGTLNLRAQESIAADPFHIKSVIGRMEII